MSDTVIFMTYDTIVAFRNREADLKSRGEPLPNRLSELNSRLRKMLNRFPTGPAPTTTAFAFASYLTERAFLSLTRIDHERTTELTLFLSSPTVDMKPTQTCSILHSHRTSLPDSWDTLAVTRKLLEEFETAVEAQNRAELRAREKLARETGVLVNDTRLPPFWDAFIRKPGDERKSGDMLKKLLDVFNTINSNGGPRALVTSSDVDREFRRRARAASASWAPTSSAEAQRG